MDKAQRKAVNSAADQILAFLCPIGHGWHDKRRVFGIIRDHVFGAKNGAVLFSGLLPVCEHCFKPEMNCDCDVPFSALQEARRG